MNNEPFSTEMMEDPVTMHTRMGFIHFIPFSSNAPFSIVRVKVEREGGKGDEKTEDQKRTTQQLNSPVVSASENPLS